MGEVKINRSHKNFIDIYDTIINIINDLEAKKKYKLGLKEIPNKQKVVGNKYEK